nr:uncharacterized protein LOC113720276 [Coffea arabica]
MPQLTEQHLHDTVAKYDRSTLPGTSDTNVTTAFFFLIFSYLAPSIRVTMIINSVYPTLDQISRIVSSAFLLMKKVILQAPTTSIYARIVVQSMTKNIKLANNAQNLLLKHIKATNVQGGKIPDGIEALKCISNELDILAPKPNCSYCEAKKLHSETPNFCCSAGQIVLQQNKFSDILIELYTGHSAEALSFRTYVRTYNNMFAFTSFGVHYDKSLCRRTNGIYTFKVQGQTYHFIKDLIPHEQKTVYLQLYFHDTEHELENRLATSEKLTESASHSENDQRVWNQPTASQIAALWVEGQKSGKRYKRHIQIYTKEGKDHLVQYYYGCYDPLQYPLLFPFGETRWHPEELIGAEHQAFDNPENNKEFVSMREYYAYKLQMRKKYTPGILSTGWLLQQYVIDMYIKIESQRLDYYRSRQQLIRREELQGIMDSVIAGHCQGSKIGQRVILPASFIGGPRDMRRRYVDAMTLVQKFGKPDLFITMTCTPSRPEVKKHMLPTDEGHNRPDLLARVFHAKLDLLKEQLFKKQIFGSVAAYTYVVEFQKRGLPHGHFLIILETASKLYSTESYDKIVSAEISDITANRHLFSMV